MPTQSQLPKRYELSPIKLWSPLQRQLALSGQRKGSPQQWMGVIRNLQKKGVSAVEIKWSQIIPALEEHPESVVHIEELLNFLGQASPCELILQRHVSDKYLPLVRYEKQQAPTKIPPIVVRHGRKEVRQLDYRDRIFGLCIWLHMEVDAGLFGRNRYWSFSVPRGRKKLTSRPVARTFSRCSEAMAYGRELVSSMAARLTTEGFTGQIRSVNFFTGYVLPGGQQYTEWLITAPNLSSKYWGPHFDLPNIVSHVRTTHHLTSQGDRLLVLEEIQSDWNQKLREDIAEARKRYPIDSEDCELIHWDDDMDPPPFNPYQNHWLEATLRIMLLLAANQDVAGIAWLPGKLHAERFPWANSSGLNTFYDQIVPKAVERLAKSWGLPLATAQIPALSRQFKVRKVTGTARWHVLNISTGKIIGGEFPDEDKAELFRDSIFPSITALYVPPQIREEILKNGLPFLGAVGSRASQWIEAVD